MKNNFDQIFGNPQRISKNEMFLIGVLVIAATVIAVKYLMKPKIQYTDMNKFPENSLIEEKITKNSNFDEVALREIIKDELSKVPIAKENKKEDDNDSAKFDPKYDRDVGKDV
jgi:hypothetical protein